MAEKRYSFEEFETIPIDNRSALRWRYQTDGVWYVATQDSAHRAVVDPPRKPSITETVQRAVSEPLAEQVSAQVAEATGSLEERLAKLEERVAALEDRPKRGRPPKEDA